MVATYMASNPGIGGSSFTAIRLIIVVGTIRVITRRERIVGGLKAMDWMMLCWGCWAACSSVFHSTPFATFLYMLGLACDGLGVYFLLRIFVRDAEDFLWIARASVLLLIPVAVGMVGEKLTGHNAFSLLDSVAETSSTRGGKIRAQGPFSHEILAGTVAAVSLPLILLFGRTHRKAALLGLAVTGTMVVTCASSGPLMTALIAFVALATWRIRTSLRWICLGAVLAIVGLDLIMNDPVYFLLARIDLTGSSTGWHRAALIQAAINHLDEWWLGGTDYTRHWMPTGVYGNPNHTDITNHYIKMGVYGGLLLMFLFISLLFIGFRYVGQALRLSRKAPMEKQFLIWMLGSILAAHAVTFISVSYFDLTVDYFYLVLASIASIHTAALAEEPIGAEDRRLDQEAKKETSPVYG
jgi:hypothetical protein